MTRTGKILGAPNFTYEELIRSDTAQAKGIDNTPSEKAWDNLERLARDILQPVRDHFGKPVRISSGYRCPKLNAAVNGAKGSHHMSGCAADFTVDGVSDRDVFQWIAENLDFTELIAENIPSGWVHCALVPDREKEKATKYMKRGGQVHRGSVDEIVKMYQA